MSRRRQTSPLVARLGLGCGGLMFLAMGLPAVWVAGLDSAVRVVQSWKWTATSCEVLYSGVEPGDNTESSSYRPLVALAYKWEGRERISGTLEVMPRDTKNEDDAKAVAATYKVGQTVACYVDPAHPERAAVLRRLSPRLGLTAIVAIFPLVGFGLLAAAVFVKLTPTQASDRDWLPAPGVPSPEMGPSGVRLDPAQTPLGKFIGLLVFNLVWNGFLTGFGFVIWNEHRQNMDWTPVLCISPFVLIGILMLFSLPYQFLALFNPRPRLYLSRASLRPGESVRARCELRPFGGRCRNVTLKLEGIEQGGLAGQSTAGQRTVFHERQLVNRPGDEGRSDFDIEIPAGAMHSFQGRTGQIVWQVTVAGQIPLFPDVAETFTLRVLPEGARP